MQTEANRTKEQRAEQTEIWRERGRLDRERMEAIGARMADFDVQHRQKIKALQDRCAAIGHVRGKFHNNGLGSTWFYCNQCGAQMEMDHGD